MKLQKWVAVSCALLGPAGRRAFRLLGLLLVGGIGIASFACTEADAARPRNLVLISLDTVRADALGCYGNPRPTSPTIDALAAQGTLFEVAYATSPWTLPSHGSLLTGQYPSRHGATSELSLLRSDAPHLAAILRNHGFETRAFVNSMLLEKYGLIDAFERRQYLVERMNQRTPSAVTNEAIAWLRQREETAPLFLFLHYYDVHSDYVSREEIEHEFLEPYQGAVDGSTRQLSQYRSGKFELSAEDGENLRQRYLAGVRQIDDELSKLIALLEATGMLEQSLVVIISDHGEEFLEHGGVLHGHTHFEEVARIPMILRGPGVPIGMRSQRPVSLIDVLPTALGLIGIETPAGVDGVKLLPVDEGAARRPLFLESDRKGREVGSKRAVLAGRMKLHVDLASGEQRLFDLATDPREKRDVSAQHPEALRLLRAELDAFVASGEQREAVDPLSEQELEHLRALGYTE